MGKHQDKGSKMVGGVHHESGWSEVGRFVGILSIIAIASLGIFVIAELVTKGQPKFNEDAILAEINAIQNDCPTNFPLSVSLTNVSDKAALNVGFELIVIDSGYSTEYNSQIIGSDRIIPPGQSYRDCYAIPEFYLESDYTTAIDGVPYNLSNPEYTAAVTGVKLRGDD
ncbi:hypothetical protein ABIE62_002761 [Porphyrobacter sp. MBR-155]|uniref:hypothetical protein n=1 Tax=Porphyrobacter sp. MBR-155 TaxID=3156464 RepID=UPI00339A9FA9